MTTGKRTKVDTCTCTCTHSWTHVAAKSADEQTLRRPLNAFCVIPSGSFTREQCWLAATNRSRYRQQVTKHATNQQGQTEVARATCHLLPCAGKRITQGGKIRWRIRSNNVGQDMQGREGNQTGKWQAKDQKEVKDLAFKILTKRPWWHWQEKTQKVDWQKSLT